MRKKKIINREELIQVLLKEQDVYMDYFDNQKFFKVVKEYF